MLFSVVKLRIIGGVRRDYFSRVGVVIRQSWPKSVPGCEIVSRISGKLY